ncbi:hypothetical protein EBX93_03825, partial [bacterium]|nr:hypothetical protein [bacterium]
NQLFENLFGKNEDQVELNSTLGQEFLDHTKTWVRPNDSLSGPNIENNIELFKAAIPFLEAFLKCLKTPEGSSALNTVPVSLKNQFFLICQQIANHKNAPK